jgi:hypothetical protein
VCVLRDALCERPQDEVNLLVPSTTFLILRSADRRVSKDARSSCKRFSKRTLNGAAAILRPRQAKRSGIVAAALDRFIAARLAMTILQCSYLRVGFGKRPRPEIDTPRDRYCRATGRAIRCGGAAGRDVGGAAAGSEARQWIRG